MEPEAPRVIVTDDEVEFPPLKNVPRVIMAGEVQFPRLEPDTTVCFLNGTRWEKEFVKSVVETHYHRVDMGVRFRFVEPENPWTVPIRITFRDKGHSHSFPDRVARRLRVHYTMLLNITFERGPVRKQHAVLHEFGHFLGLKHQHQHPDAGFKWNEEALKGLGLTNDMVIGNYTGHIVSPCGAPYDRDSIMHYEIQPWQTHNITEAITPGSVLSKGDKELLMLMYPKPLSWYVEEMVVEYIQRTVAGKIALPVSPIAEELAPAANSLRSATDQQVAWPCETRQRYLGHFQRFSSAVHADLKQLKSQFLPF
ncbi:tyrosinase [Apiospora arundinis]